MQTFELRPCPKCGRDDDAIEYAIDDATRKWSVVCLGCGAEGLEADNMDDAAALWNLPPDPSKALIAKLTEALEQMIEHYTSLVNCGDCGNWNPEEEEPVKLARAALSLAKSETPQ